MSKSVQSLLVFVLLLCLPGTGHALRADKSLHHYERAHWSIQDGLPQVSATSIVQDRQGYLWVGTLSGLARFDGVRFTRFTPENEPALPGMWVRALHIARDGRLWIGTYKGVAVYDGVTFQAVPAADDKRWPAPEINAFAEDEAGNLWAASSEGLFRIEQGRLHAVPGSPVPALSLLLRKQALWVGSIGAAHRLAQQRWQVRALPAGAAQAAIGRLVDTQGKVWAGTSLGLFTHGRGGWTAAAAGAALGTSPVDLLHVGRDGDLWAGGDAGIVRIVQRRAVDFVAPGDPGGIRAVRTAFDDREGNLWFGSLSEGVIRLRDSWTRRYSTPEGLHDPNVWSLSPDPDGKRIWVGSSDGLSVFEHHRFQKVVGGEALPHPSAYNLLAERERVWIGTRRGLALIEHGGPLAGRVQRPALFAPLASAQINGLVRVPNGDLWIPSSEGLYRVRDGVLHGYGHAQGLSDRRVRYFHRAPDGRIFAGTQSGLFQLQGERFVPVGVGKGLPADLDIIAIATLDDGRVVVSSLDEQILFSDGDRWHALRDEDGMPGNAAFLLVQYDGYLWTGGLRGITRVPVLDLGRFASGALKRVRGEMLLNERGDSQRGQQGLCCNGAGNSKGFLRTGTLWFPSRDGIVALDSDSPIDNPVAPGVVIERVQVGEAWRAAHAIQGQALPAQVRDLTFEFTLLSLQDPGSVTIEYRLGGYDRQWRQADAAQRSARYTNLPPGRYTLEVRGSNNAGVPSARNATLAFSIEPLFHETAWFAALLGLLLLALLYAAYRVLLQRHRQQQQVLELLVRQRTEDLEIANRELKDVSDTDPLTGLRNRRYMSSQLPIDLAYYDRRAREGEHRGEVMAFALLDIDHFKRINDDHGHLAGDHALTQVADVLRELVRSGDYVARWGGEEFLVVFRPMRADQTAIVAARLCEAVAAHGFVLEDGRALKMTCSVGLAEYPLSTQQELPMDWTRLIELADRALYHVKHNGRNGWAAFCPLDRADVAVMLRQIRDNPSLAFGTSNQRFIGSITAQRPAE